MEKVAKVRARLSIFFAPYEKGRLPCLGGAIRAAGVIGGPRGGYHSGMCGRYQLRKPGQAKKLVYSEDEEEFSEIRIVPKFSYRPSEMLPIIRFDEGKHRVFAEAKWGFVPFWTKEKPPFAPINAKSETVATNGMYREAFKQRRCIIPADGFWEPKGAASLKIRQPYFFRRPDAGVFALAGLWDRWVNPQGELVATCVMLTTGPNELMRPIHERMPVILQPDDYDRWLDPEKAYAQVGRCCGSLASSGAG